MLCCKSRKLCRCFKFMFDVLYFKEFVILFKCVVNLIINIVKKRFEAFKFMFCNRGWRVDREFF